LSVPIVSLPGATRLRLAAAHASGVADGATDGAVETTAAADGDAADGATLDPALVHAAARTAMRPSELIVVLRIGVGSSGRRGRARVYPWRSQVVLVAD
jgi:hypothetical protein